MFSWFNLLFFQFFVFFESSVVVFILGSLSAVVGAFFFFALCLSADFWVNTQTQPGIV